MGPETSGATPDGEPLDDGDPAERRSAPTERVVAVMNFLAKQSGPVTLGQIAEGTGITHGACLPLLRSLVASGWVVRRPRLRHYLLGQVPVALETMAREEDTWYAEARRACDDVAAASRLRVSLTVVVDLELVVIYQSLPADQLPTAHTMPLYGAAGHRSPFAAPYGATLAAWMPEAERRAWIERAAPEVASQGDELSRRLDGIRARGFNVHRYTPMALEVQDLYRAGILGRDEGLRAAAQRVIASVGVEPLTELEFDADETVAVGWVAAPALDPEGHPVMAFTVDGGGQLMDRDERHALGHLIEAAAQRITARFAEEVLPSP